MLERQADDLWTVAAPLSLFGMRIGTRMTIVRLSGGGLLVHSPVPLSAELLRAIDALGPVQHVVCPNLYHHLHAGPMMQAYPDALLHAPAGLAKKRPDLRLDAVLSETPHEAWADDLVPLTIEGCMLGETVLLHPRSRTVISADLAENFETSDHLPTRLYLKLGGIHGRVGWSRLLRFLYRDHAAARASVERLLERDFDRVIVAHGRVIGEGGKQAVRQTFEWL